MDLELVVSIVVFVSTGLGLGFALRFLRWMTGVVKDDTVKNVITTPFVRLTLWLILGALFAKPFMDCASLLIEIARIPYLITQPVAERSLPVGWGISHQAVYVGIRVLLLGMVYGYAFWAIPKIIASFALEKGLSIHSNGFERLCVILASGGILHSVIASVAFSIQQLPISAWLGSDDSTAGYFLGWLVVFLVLPVVIYGLNKIINKKYETASLPGVNLP